MTHHELPHASYPCPVCHVSDNELLYTINEPDRLMGVVGGERIRVSGVEHVVRCRACSMVYVEPRIIWPGGGRAHTVNYDLAYFRETRVDRRTGNAHLLTLVESLCEGQGRWLDVGSGDGLLVRQALAAGWEAQGVEIDAAIVRASLAKEGDLPIATEPLEQLALDAKTWHAISLINVLEHVESPREIMAECTRLLVPGGLLIVHVPNGASLGARLRKDHWRHFEPLNHYHYFTADTLSDLMRRYDFEPIQRFSLPGANQGKRWLLALLDRLGVHGHDGLGLIARRQAG